MHVPHVHAYHQLLDQQVHLSCLSMKLGHAPQIFNKLGFGSS